MLSRLLSTHHDLITPDGFIKEITLNSDTEATALIQISDIPDPFLGFSIEPELVEFNLKSTLAQLGLNGIGKEYFFDPLRRHIEVQVELKAHGVVARQLLALLRPRSYIGKLFAADPRRRVRDPDYLGRMFGRSDRNDHPLLLLGGLQGSQQLVLEKINGRTVAYLSLRDGVTKLAQTASGFLPTLSKALIDNIPMRNLLKLHQEWHPHQPRILESDEILLVKTHPLHVRTVFARVINEYLPQGYTHTSAAVLQPDTKQSGDIYEFFGSSEKELSDIPLEFYTLEPYREHVFFSDRDQLKSCLEEDQQLFNAFKTIDSEKPSTSAAVFIVKSQQLLSLDRSDWSTCELRQHDFPGILQGTRQTLMVERYIEQQPAYQFLKFIEDGLITSQGVLLTRHFPTPLLKRMLLGNLVRTSLKGIYFLYPSRSHDLFFSEEDRSLLQDLYKFAIPTYWVDQTSQKVLQYLQRPGATSGMFVPIAQAERFLNSTIFGIYGSNLLEGEFEEEVKALLQGIQEMRTTLNHPQLNSNRSLALVTGGGPGAMAVGNRVAQELGILSCANILDFRMQDRSVVNEQLQNPYVEAKMTYRLDKLVERQAEFNLDFPIFLTGGIGTDFELTLEEVRRKVGAAPPTPIILFGPKEYWEAKITTRFQCNQKMQTTKGSEWLSNCFYRVDNAKEAIEVYRRYFSGELLIGPESEPAFEGYVDVSLSWSVR